jgi:hypothetical protein
MKRILRDILMSSFIQFRILNMSDDQLGELISKLRLWDKE